MSIFRVEKNSNYTVMSNYHLRDTRLTLRTIGLLSLILSLPENWDYSQAGLAAICKDGIDSIRKGLLELEEYGYLERERERDERGRVKGTIYRVFETPKEMRDNDELNNHPGSKKTKPVTAKSRTKKQGDINKNFANQEVEERNSPKSDLPILEKPILENPTQVNPILEKPTLENPTQINKDKSNKDLSSTESINLPIYQKDGQIERRLLISQIKKQIGYEPIKQKRERLDAQFDDGKISMNEYDEYCQQYDIEILDHIVEYMFDVLSSLNNDPIKIGNELIDRDVVKAKLLKVNLVTVKQVIRALKTYDVKNPKKYAISMLYNA